MIDSLCADFNLWRKALRVCLHTEGYKSSPAAWQRFREVSEELRLLERSKKQNKPNSNAVQQASQANINNEQAIAFRAILKKSGKCDSPGDAYIVGKPKVAESMRKQVCAKCEVRVMCAEYAMVYGEEHGMWGGLSERGRRRINKNINTDFELSKLGDLRTMPPDSKVRTLIREKIPEYLATEDKVPIAGTGRKKKKTQSSA